MLLLLRKAQVLCRHSNRQIAISDRRGRRCLQEPFGAAMGDNAGIEIAHTASASIGQSILRATIGSEQRSGHLY